MDDNKDKRAMPVALRIALALAVLTLCWLFLSRGKETSPTLSAPKTPSFEPTAVSTQQLQSHAAPSPAEGPAEQSSEQPAEQTAEQPQTAETDSLPAGAQPAETEEREYIPVVYDAKSYQLVTDMVYAYKMQVTDWDRIVAADVAALKDHNPRLGEAWGGIMDYWDYANQRMELNYGPLPEDLPQDDSLCIVVLGFQLEPDGAMAPEMHGRCQLALQAAQQYPNAYLVVTGGGTAYKNREATEAGVMADWFLRKGVAEERLIREVASSTTEENALFTRAILTERYPQVKSLIIVSSDYHLPLGCLMFTEAALLYECEYGEAPFAVVGNLALSGYGIYEYKNPQEQGLYVWRVADPQLHK